MIRESFRPIEVAAKSFRIIGVHASVSDARKAREHAVINHLVIERLSIAVKGIRILLAGGGELKQFGHVGADGRGGLHDLIRSCRRAEQATDYVNIAVA